MCKAVEICEKPFVVIQCLAYNHQPYIRQCLDGFIMQKTDFPFVAVIHDDASTDGTAEIIKEYERKYPAIIKGIYQKENQYKTNPEAIGNSIRPFLTGKYIAMCEGDDYWTDPLKLQKQVDFLEANSDYSFCCARFLKYNQSDGTFEKEFAFKYYIEGKNLDITKPVFFKTWVTQPLTALIRNDLYLYCMDVLKGYKYSRDVHLFYHLLKKGKGCSLNEFIGVYRIHSGGVAGTRNSIQCVIDSKKIYLELWQKNKMDVYLLMHLLYILSVFRYKKLMVFFHKER